MAVKSGARVRLRLWKSVKPSEVDLGFYRRVDRHGRARGKSEDVEFRLRPFSKDDRIVAWEVVFLARGTHHYYLGLLARWGENDAIWKFHFRSVN